MYKKYNEITNHVQKPLLLSKQKWNSILDLLIDKKAIQSAEERTFCEYLKNGSKTMTKNWESMFATNVKEVNDTGFENLKRQDEKTRKEKIEKAEHMIQKLLAGPRELESAAMYCEILKGRQIQLDFNEKMRERKRREKMEENMLFQAQAEPYLEEERKRVHLDLERKEKFKNYVKQDIKEKNEQYEEYKKTKIEGEKKMLELMKQDLQKHENVIRTGEYLKRNRFRKEALDDLEIKHQKAYKMAIEDKIEDKLNSAFLKKQNEMELTTKSKQNQRKYHRMRFIEENAKKVFENIIDPAPTEETRRIKKIEEETKIYQSKQKQAIEKKKFLQNQRIKDHQNYLQYRKKMDEIQKKTYNDEVTNRLKNEKIYQEYLKENKLNKIKIHKKNEKILKNLVKEQKNVESFEKLMDIKLNTVSYNLQDKFFLNYANQLIKDAKEKGRPIFPLQKAVVSYKKAHELDKKIVVPPHLRTNIVLVNE